HRQDGPRHSAAVRADGRAEVRHLVRRLLELRRPVLGLLLGYQGCRSGNPGRRVRAWLPPASGGAATRHPEASGEDREREPRRAVQHSGRGPTGSLGDHPHPSAGWAEGVVSVAAADEATRTARAAAQWLAAPRGTPRPLAVVRHVVALQAQLPSAAALAIRPRSGGIPAIDG